MRKRRKEDQNCQLAAEEKDWQHEDVINEEEDGQHEGDKSDLKIPSHILEVVPALVPKELVKLKNCLKREVPHNNNNSSMKSRSTSNLCIADEFCSSGQSLLPRNNQLLVRVNRPSDVVLEEDVAAGGWEHGQEMRIKLWRTTSYLGRKNYYRAMRRRRLLQTFTQHTPETGSGQFDSVDTEAKSGPGAKKSPQFRRSLTEEKGRLPFYYPEEGAVAGEDSIPSIRRRIFHTAIGESNSNTVQVRFGPVGAVVELSPEHQQVQSRSLATLTWNTSHTVNNQGVYCYCRQDGEWYRGMVQCERCAQWFHERCLAPRPRSMPIVQGDTYYLFVCSLCNYGVECLKRMPVPWEIFVHIAFFDLTLKHEKKFLEVEREVLETILTNWEVYQLPRCHNLLSTEDKRTRILSLINHSSLYKREGECWGLRQLRPPPRGSFTLNDMGPVSERNVLDDVVVNPSIQDQDVIDLPVLGANRSEENNIWFLGPNTSTLGTQQGKKKRSSQKEISNSKNFVKHNSSLTGRARESTSSRRARDRQSALSQSNGKHANNYTESESPSVINDNKIENDGKSFSPVNGIPFSASNKREIAVSLYMERIESTACLLTKKKGKTDSLRIRRGGKTASFGYGRKRSTAVLSLARECKITPLDTGTEKRKPVLYSRGHKASLCGESEKKSTCQTMINCFLLDNHGHSTLSHDLYADSVRKFKDKRRNLRRATRSSLLLERLECRRRRKEEKLRPKEPLTDPLFMPLLEKPLEVVKPLPFQIAEELHKKGFPKVCVKFASVVPPRKQEVMAVLAERSPKKKGQKKKEKCDVGREGKGSPKGGKDENLARRKVLDALIPAKTSYTGKDNPFDLGCTEMLRKARSLLCNRKLDWADLTESRSRLRKRKHWLNIEESRRLWRNVDSTEPGQPIQSVLPLVNPNDTKSLISSDFNDCIELNGSVSAARAGRQQKYNGIDTGGGGGGGGGGGQKHRRSEAGLLVGRGKEIAGRCRSAAGDLRYLIKTVPDDVRGSEP